MCGNSFTEDRRQKTESKRQKRSGTITLRWYNPLDMVNPALLFFTNELNH
jgi:hypothetical protein